MNYEQPVPEREHCQICRSNNLRGKIVALATLVSTGLSWPYPFLEVLLSYGIGQFVHYPRGQLLLRKADNTHWLR